MTRRCKFFFMSCNFSNIVLNNTNSRKNTPVGQERQEKWLLLLTFKSRLCINLRLLALRPFFTIISQTLNEWMGSFEHHVFLLPPFFFFPLASPVQSFPPLVPYVRAPNVSQIIPIERTHAPWWLTLHPSAHNNMHNDVLCLCGVICFTHGHYTSPLMLCE